MSNSVTISGVGDVRGVKQLSYVGHGVIKTRPKDELGVRLSYIFTKLSDVVAQYRPDIAAIEDIFVNAKNPRSTLKLGCARGAALVALRITIEGVEIKEFPPTIVKRYVSGYGLADKDLVAQRVKMILGKECPAVSKDGADALAIAICGSCSCNNPLYKAA
ncbi:MAG: crossover junction endodeoxyribonuclease RuvC [Holosporales bacterium]|nr:crossover junction endodeoxyribonuclease RuvC [Holosporales bacterium]